MCLPTFIVTATEVENKATCLSGNGDFITAMWYNGTSNIVFLAIKQSGINYQISWPGNR